jgi:Ser/Thr protein kinase RdoA (MazF antagonist)
VDNNLISELRITVAKLLGLDSEVIAVSPLHTGVSSQNYEVTADSSSYIVRVDLYRDLFDVDLDESVAGACRDIGVNTPPPALWVGSLGKFPVSVRPFVPGLVLEQIPEPRTDIFYECGHQLALIHGAKVSNSREWFYELPIAELQRARRISRSSTDDSLAYEAESLFKQCADEADILLKNRGLIHSDFRAGNIVIRSGGTPVILDWEKATIGPTYFDLGLSLFHIMTTESEEDAAARLEAFISGYSRSHFLTRETVSNLASVSTFAASTFYLVDHEIANRPERIHRSNPVDDLHYHYYVNYCQPRFRAYLQRRSWLT